MLFDGKTLNKAVPIPLYFQLKELILSEIKNGNYKDEDMIPTENEISDMFQISRTTVRQAVTELVQEGWLYRIKSKGTFVTHPKINQDFLKKLESFQDQMRRLGMEPRTELLKLETVKADAQVAKALQIAEGEDVIYLYRRRFGNDEPLVTIQTYLPAKRCSFVMKHDLEKEALYEILAKNDGTKIYRISRTIEAVEANAEDERLIGISVGKPIQYFVSIGYSTAGVALEYSLARYRGDRNRFEITIFAE